MEEMPPGTASEDSGRAAPAEQTAAWVGQDDLIDDRALTDLGGDAFRLGDIVEEVAGLCRSAPLPATVALYGSWGSGKSSLGNLLATEFKQDENVSFARFDAFKYAEVPLRRHFLSQVASAFGISDSKFSEDLYASRKDVRLHIPSAKWWQLALVIGVAAAITTAIAALLAAVIAALSKGGLEANFSKALKATLPGIALATPLLAVAIGLVGQYLTAETTLEAPSSEEQFESLFLDLVEAIKKKQKCDRIVIFIDELDRCSPHQVVSALETLRTFLEVPPCVFLVAADQQVLEHALTDAARQATPVNLANPYYSAGSAYLDKIFQYQLQLPPVLPRRLSHYALGLIESRKGVWAKVDNRAELVSVLVPTHVTSPRRVKVLLNSFALFYRLALMRASEQIIDAGVEARAAEVAKLVCLRTEFPLFAADLQLDARLPDVVLRVYDKLPEDAIRDEFRGLSAEAFLRAGAYAEERLPVDEVIAQEVRTASTPTLESDADADDTAVRVVESSHARQLIRYLERTRGIPSPGRDLVFLESSGAAFGLPAQLAEQIERDAIDGRNAEVIKEVEALAGVEQPKAYRLLARLVVEAVGIEARNVTRALFGAIAVGSGDLSVVANDLLTALVTYNSDYALEPEDLHGALALALSHSGLAAQKMREAVLERDELLADDGLGLLALEHASQLRRHDERLGAALSGLLSRGSGLEAERALEGVADADVERLVSAAPLDDDEATYGMRDFVESAKSNNRDGVATRGFKRLVDTDTDVGTECVGAVVSLFAPVLDSELAAAVVNRAVSRPVSDWTTWLAALDTATVRGLQNIDPALDALLLRLWHDRFVPHAGAAPLPEDQFTAAGQELGRLRPLATEERAMVDLLAGTPAATTPPLTASRVEQVTALWQLSELEALPEDAAAQSVLNDLAQTLASPQAAPTPAPISDYVVNIAPRALDRATEEALRTFLAATEACAWLDPTAREILRVRVACALHRLQAETEEPPIDILSALVANASAAADEALAEWIAGFTPDPAQVLRVLRPRLQDGHRLPETLQSATTAAAGRWTPDQKADLLDEVADDYRDGILHDSVLRAVGVSDADPERAGNLLVEAYLSSTNNEQRSQVMALWALVDPTPDRVRRLLVDKVYIPLLKEGKGATRIALDYFALVRNPPSQAAQERLKKAIRKAAEETSELARRADRLLGEAGWISTKRKWLWW